MKFMMNIHLFRAFAIIFVICNHIGTIPNPSGIPELKISQTFIGILFGNSTIYFLFISGFLYATLAHKYTALSYYANKFKNVIMPYLIISIAVLLLLQLRQHSWTLTFGDFLEIILKGQAQFPFWYIPFVSIIYLISPYLIKIESHTFSVIVLWSSLLPLLGTRTSLDVTFLQFVYFLPVYLIGMFTGMHYQWMKSKIIRWKYLLMLLTVASTATMILIKYSEPSDLTGNYLSSCLYMQKISLSLLLIVFFERFTAPHAFIIRMAEVSFTMYFLHTIIALASVRVHLFEWGLSKGAYAYWLLLPSYLIIAILVIFFVSSTLNKVLGKHSRYLIGS